VSHLFERLYSAIIRSRDAIIWRVSGANPLWDIPRIAGELAKLGIELAKSVVDKYSIRSPKPSSPTGGRCLTNHVTELVSIHFFIVPTIRFKVLFVLIMLAHSRRKVVHFSVTDPTAEWTGQ
jgi:putative transposase